MSTHNHNPADVAEALSLSGRLRFEFSRNVADHVTYGVCVRWLFFSRFLPDTPSRRELFRTYRALQRRIGWSRLIEWESEDDAIPYREW